MKEFEDFEIVPCTLTGKVNYEPYPWGTYHLNLVPPLAVARCNDTGMLYLCPRPNRKHREAMLNGVLPGPLRDYGEATYNYGEVDKLRSTDFIDRIRMLNDIFFNSDRRILDVGTSAGGFMQVAEKHGWKAEGIEPFPDDVRRCREKGLSVIHGVAESLPFPENSFDVVHTSHVFEHLEDPLKAAKEALRVLKPGGLLFIEIPNQLDNFGFHRDILFRRVQQRKRDISSIHHLWFFGRETLGELYRRAGFDEIKILNKYHRVFKGWRLPFSLLSRAASSLLYGTYIIRGVGFKPKADV